MFSQMSAPVSIPACTVWGFRFLSLLISVRNIVGLCDSRCPGGCEVVCYCGCDLRFPGDWCHWAPSRAHWTSVCVPREMRIQSLCPLFESFVFLLLSYKNSCMPGPYQIGRHFLPFGGLSFHFLEVSFETQVLNVLEVQCIFFPVCHLCFWYDI